MAPTEYFLNPYPASTPDGVTCSYALSRLPGLFHPVFFQAFFDKIITFVTFMDALFFALAASDICVRRKLKNAGKALPAYLGISRDTLIFITLQSIFAINIFMQKLNRLYQVWVCWWSVWVCTIGLKENLKSKKLAIPHVGGILFLSKEVKSFSRGNFKRFLLLAQNFR